RRPRLRAHGPPPGAGRLVHSPPAARGGHPLREPGPRPGAGAAGAAALLRVRRLAAAPGRVRRGGPLAPGAGRGPAAAAAAGGPGGGGGGGAPAEPGELRVLLPADVTARARAAAVSSRLTLGTVVQGAWASLLAGAAERSDVVFGTVVSGRPPDLPGVESMLG